ncbi:MAG: HAD family phosphatase [Bacteroidota bacterium]|nr:HAD family phosphatase [Bacteroidota bacterium]
MQKIENIIFDLGGVLLDIDYNLTRIAFEKLGVVQFDEMYSQANADQLFQKLETGDISEGNFYKEINRSTGLQLSEIEIREAWNAMLLSFREESLTFLDQVRDRYKIFLLSNTNHIHHKSFYEIYHQKERGKSFEQYFDKAFYSFEIGLRKPEAICYEWVLKDLKIVPEKTLFIDDSINNIEGAKLVGLQTVHLTAEKRIENLGL